MSAPLVSVTVKTRVLPPFTLNVPPDSSAGTGGIASKLLALAQPSVSISVAGQQVQTWAPAGEPSTNFFPLVVAAGIILLVLAGVGIHRILRG